MGAGKRFLLGVAEGDDAATAINAALSQAEKFSRTEALEDGVATRLAIVVEELVSNAFRRGSARQVGLALTVRHDAVLLALDDDGAAFDPTIERGFAGPDTETGGGVGLALIRAWADSWDYVREGERNRMRLTLPRT